jgi:hypothetical protein
MDLSSYFPFDQIDSVQHWNQFDMNNIYTHSQSISKEKEMSYLLESLQVRDQFDEDPKIIQIHAVNKKIFMYE